MYNNNTVSHIAYFAIGFMIAVMIFAPATAATDSIFDTSTVENDWYVSELDYGTVRMVGAWKYADGVLEDETGMLWGIDLAFDDEAFYMLWIADGGTPDNTMDDAIVDLWIQNY